MAAEPKTSETPETPKGLEAAAKRYMQEVKDCECKSAPYMELVVNHSFEAAHRLPKHTGKCRQMHGHSYRVRVVIRLGDTLSDGMIIDFQVVKDIIDQLDHQYLNDFMEDPTAELTARWLLRRIPGAVTVRLWEGLGGCSAIARV